MVELAETSPYLYASTAFFVLGSFFSDLLCIRFFLTLGFLGLCLAGLSGFDSSGSFQDMPLSNGIIDITLLVNLCLFALNTLIVVRLVRDEMPGPEMTDPDQEALFHFFQSRCGLRRVQFDPIYQHGNIVSVKKGQVLPDGHRKLFLVMEGRVSCYCIFHGVRSDDFLKRSGEFFDIRMFNLFSLPVGFDNEGFQVHALVDTKLFAWDMEGLIAMRQMQSPALSKFWEFTVIRSLCGAAIRHHLTKTDTLYDSLLIPEDENWLWGAPSRDFMSRQPPPTRWQCLKEQFRMFAHSMQLLPPRGVRHRPGIREPNIKQADLEAMISEKEAKTQRSKFSIRRKQDSIARGNTRDETEEELVQSSSSGRNENDGGVPPV